MENYITDVKNVVRSLNKQLESAIQEVPNALKPDNSFNCIGSYKEIKAMIKKLGKQPEMDLFFEIEDRILKFNKEAQVAETNDDSPMETYGIQLKMDHYEYYRQNTDPETLKKEVAFYLGLQEEYLIMPEESRELREQVYRIRDNFRNAFLFDRTYKQYKKTVKSIVKFEETHNQTDLMKAEKNIMQLYHTASYDEAYEITGIDINGERTSRYIDMYRMSWTPEGLRARGLKMLGVETMEEAREILGLARAEETE